MFLPNNRKVSESDLRRLHIDLAQWVQFCTNYDTDLSKEVVQQTYLKVIEGKAKYEEKSDLKTWLFGVARLTTLEVLRDWKNVHPVGLGTESISESEMESELVVSIDHFANQVIAKAISELSLIQREVVYLHFYKEFSLSEIAQVLGVSIGTVRTQYHRAKINLNGSLSNWRPKCKTI